MDSHEGNAQSNFIVKHSMVQMLKLLRNDNKANVWLLVFSTEALCLFISAVPLVFFFISTVSAPFVLNISSHMTWVGDVGERRKVFLMLF